MVLSPVGSRLAVRCESPDRAGEVDSVVKVANKDGRSAIGNSKVRTGWKAPSVGSRRFPVKIGVIDVVAEGARGAGANEAEVEARLDRLAQAEAQGYAAVWVGVRAGQWASAGRSLFAVAALAQRTRSLRVGLRSPLPGDLHPLRLAEDLANLDILSGGRLDWAPTGDPSAEVLEIVLRAWRGEPFAHQGDGYAFPELRCLPRPEQRPHPSLWLEPRAGSLPAAAPERTGQMIEGEVGLPPRALGDESQATGRPLALIYPISAQGGAGADDWLAGLGAWRTLLDPDWILVWPEAGSGDEPMAAATQRDFAQAARDLSA
jgi:hypothetical protein